MSEKEAEFKNYVFPKRFSDSNTQLKNKNRLQSKKNSNFLTSKIYFSQRSNTTERVKSNNIEVQCELEFNQKKRSEGDIDKQEIKENKKRPSYTIT